MLSYQHSYHAGNLADVHKHAMLAWMLDYMAQKPKPLSYLETHAGRALYDLESVEARKTGEAAQGIRKVQSWFATDHPYSKVLAASAPAYPGSPSIAAQLLRDDDTLTLAELHPAEAEALRTAMINAPAEIRQQDGFALMLSKAPPDPRRGLLLCDPSFEVKEDYATIPDFFAKLHRRWPVGVLVLWYPILTSQAHRPMVAALRRQFQNGLSHEVRFPPAREGHGMTGSGLFVINPPYGLAEEAARLSKRFASL